MKLNLKMRSNLMVNEKKQNLMITYLRKMKEVQTCHKKSLMPFKTDISIMTLNLGLKNCKAKKVFKKDSIKIL